MERYWCGWKKRSLRTVSVLTRLAVKLATQPEANSRRTLAMSTWEDKIRKPHGVKLAHGRAHQAEHDVQVVDHQVQHHVDVQRAAMEDAEPVGFEKHRPVDQRLEPR